MTIILLLLLGFIFFTVFLVGVSVLASSLSTEGGLDTTLTALLVRIFLLANCGGVGTICITIAITHMVVNIQGYL